MPSTPLQSAVAYADATTLLSATAITWQPVGGCVLPRSPGFAAATGTGMPSLLQTVNTVVLPANATVLGVEVLRATPQLLTIGSPPLPIQPRGFDVSDERLSARLNAHRTTLLQELKPVQPAAVSTPAIVAIASVTRVGGATVVGILVRPLQWDSASKHFTLYPSVTFRVRYQLAPPEALAEDRPLAHWAEPFAGPATSRAGYVVAEGVLQRPVVFRPRPQPTPPIHLQRSLTNTAYLILSDDRSWPATHGQDTSLNSKPPKLSDAGAAWATDAAGLSALDHLRRLALWKSAKGVPATVVTVTEIIGGVYGDFTQGGFARDLQEVLRNFIKYAYTHAQTQYVLLGAGVTTLPMRHFVTTAFSPDDGWDFTRDTVNPPLPRKFCMLAGNQTAKLHLDMGLLDGDDDPWANPRALCATTSGQLIPFDAGATATGLRWFYISPAEFADTSKTSGFTPLARPPEHQPVTAKSPPPGVYLVVAGPEAVVNDPYGFYWTWPNRFVPSDMYYSSLRHSGYDAPGLHDFDCMNSGMYGQCTWDASAGNEVPINNSWAIAPDVMVGRIPATSAVETGQFVDKLVVYERLHTVASTLEPSRDLSSIDTGFLGSTPDSKPVDTAYLSRITYLATNWYADDPKSVDDSVAQVEALRAQMKAWFPAVNLETRVYQDADNFGDPSVLTFPPDNATPPCALQGTHFLAINGHGGWWTIAQVNWNTTYTNVNRPFIAFANGCDSAAEDGPYGSGDDRKCVGAVTVLSPNGAIAYVGNTYMSGITNSNLFAEKFWCLLHVCKRPGVAANFRLSAAGHQDLGESFMQTYYGCPEMPAWTQAPLWQTVNCPTTAKLGQSIHVTVADSAGNPIRNAQVTLLAGWSNNATEVSQTVVVDAYGAVEFDLPATLKSTAVTITSTLLGYVPYVATVTVAPA